MTASRPDSFLVLMADQLAAGWLPAYGHSVVHAPHLSELAARGTVFDSAYTPFPLCAPARAAMLTGRYASRVGVYDNAAEFRAGAPTVVHALRAAGYHTAVSGKMHFVGPDQLHGFEERLTTDIYPADVDWTPDWSRPLEDPLPWYHTMESVLAPGICPAAMQTDYDDEVAFQAVRKLYDIARHHAEQPYFLFVSWRAARLGSGGPHHGPVLRRSRRDAGGAGARVRISQRERFLVSRALRQGRPTPWDHDPPYDAAVRYIRNREDMYELQRQARLDAGKPE
jgi:arylsulfatase A-like enzyme